jgi:hypothetical protein
VNRSTSTTTGRSAARGTNSSRSGVETKTGTSVESMSDSASFTREIRDARSSDASRYGLAGYSSA